MQIKDKVFIVTGAGSGIGKQLTLKLLSEGAKVAAVDVRKENLDGLQAEVSPENKNLSIHVVDITDQKGVEKLPKEVIKIHGSLDGLINNAGIIQPFVKVVDLDRESIDRVMNINFFGTLNMIKAFLPELLKRPEAHLVNISSMGGFLPVPGQSIYGASKAAVKLMTEGLYAELKDTKVKVSVVFPGAIATNITQNSGVKAPEMPKDAKEYKALPPQKAAEIIVGGIKKDKFQIFVGSDSKLMNFLYRVNPKMATNFIAKQMKSLLAE